eukprot:TRINITY_DN36259_c0_g1_i1.p1 TRINITY_DN36259_c0_g1~~TRINITY_DN36259_c0_g1_i1.p1  ORF type:complete len:407 (+),score=91.02 TRINITY_DN36259_c0_g1_i1:164-1384(+)
MRGRGGGQWKVRATPQRWKQVSSLEEEAEDTGREASELPVHNGETTIMLGGLPKLFMAEHLLALLDKDYALCYDFFYLPVDFVNFTNMGYAFVNFRTPEKALECAEYFSGFSAWGLQDSSENVCKVKWATVQGIEANIAQHQKTALIGENVPEDCKPWVFDEHGKRIPSISLLLPTSTGKQSSGKAGGKARSNWKAGYEHAQEEEDDSWWADEWYGGPAAERWQDNEEDWYGTGRKDKNPSAQTGKTNGVGAAEAGDLSQSKRTPLWKARLKDKPSDKQVPSVKESGVNVKVEDIFQAARGGKQEEEVSLESSLVMPQPVSGLGVPKYACLACGQGFAKWSACQHHMIQELGCRNVITCLLGCEIQVADADKLQQMCKEKALTCPNEKVPASFKDEAILREVRRFQ